MATLKNYASCHLITPSFKKTLLTVITAYALSLIIASYIQKIAHHYTTQAFVNSLAHDVTNTGRVQRTTPNITHAGQVMRHQTHQKPSLCLDDYCPTANASNPITKITLLGTPIGHP